MPPITLDGTRGITTPTYNGNTTAEYLVPVTGFKNRIINGDMVIDQRNAGAAISVSGSYPVDRFYVIEGATSATFTSQRSTTAPAGFTNSLLFTVGTGASAGASEQVQIRQAIEGFNIADLGWGTANAKTVTLSFQVRASVTGTYCVFLQDTNATLSYVATYTISAANTWETKSITIAGPTTGTFDTTNSTGVMIGWDLGSGSNFNATAGAWQSAVSARRTTGQTNFINNSGATFFLTGVQFEVGSNATSFDYLPYGTELALCQRYFQVLGSGAFKPLGPIGYFSSTGLQGVINTKVTMRAAPTLSIVTGTNFYIAYTASNNDLLNSVTLDFASTDAIQIYNSTEASGTANAGGSLATNNASAFIAVQAEL
jgi:hypothetical protein